MDSTRTPAYQQQLLALRSALLTQIAAQRGGAVGRADVAAEHFDHPEDPRAQVLTERVLEFALDERELAELTQIDAALERIRAGRYGVCVNCGADIAPARLLAAPEAARCLSCQMTYERNHLNLT